MPCSLRGLVLALHQGILIPSPMPHDHRPGSLGTMRLLAKRRYCDTLQCALCHSTIDTLDDAELDHSVPYSKGGSSEASNAQLVHTRCNSFKGSKSNEGYRKRMSAPSNS